MTIAGSSEAGVLLGLAERCEKASGADRVLDRLILEATSDFRELGHNYFEMGGWYYSLDGDERNPAYPSPTSSLDDAMKLVPEGFKWKLTYSKYVPFVAELCDYGPNSAYGRFDAECDSNHALALVSAALRARAALSPTGNDGVDGSTQVEGGV